MCQNILWYTIRGNIVVRQKIMILLFSKLQMSVHKLLIFYLKREKGRAMSGDT